MKQHLVKGVAAIAAAVMISAAGGAAAQGAWKPERNVEILVGSGTGTGTDRTARLMQKIFQEQKAMEVPMTVVNRPGGGGTVLWAYLGTKAGDGHHVMVTSYNLVTNYLNGRSKLNYTDFTLLSLLISEYIGYAVRAESPMKTIGDLVAALKQDPGSVVVGTSSVAGGANHIAMGLLAKAVGVEPRRLKVVIYGGGNEGVAAVLGGHVGVFVNSASSLGSHQAAGTLRTLAMASPQRLPGAYANVPTLKESGINVIADNWRMVAGPKGMTAGQIAFWDGALKRLASSEEWNKDLVSSNMSNGYRDSAGTLRYVTEEYSDIKGILTDLGLVKAPN